MRRPWRKYLADAKVAYEKEDFPHAEKLLLDALRAARDLRPHHRDRIQCVEDLAMLYRAQSLADGSQSKRKLARQLYESTLEVVQSARGPEHPSVAERLVMLAVSFCEDNPEEAGQLLRRAMRIYQTAYGLYDGRVVMTYIFLGQNEARLRRFDRAEARLKQAVELAEKLQSGGSWFLATALKNLGGLYYGLERFVDAEKAFREVLASEEREYGMESQQLMDALECLGRALRRQGRTREAEAVFLRSRDIGLREVWGQDPKKW
ncbi:MAG: tetratricopeptide repeat protein [Planctomycetota bacterium]|nr:tetratricopeptide repeat protein [Planctomycetota bacterium]